VSGLAGDLYDSGALCDQEADVAVAEIVWRAVGALARVAASATACLRQPRARSALHGDPSGDGKMRSVSAAGRSSSARRSGRP
jgi:hypothetical protein